MLQPDLRARPMPVLEEVVVPPVDDLTVTLTVGIVGLGYVGLPTALAFGCRGHRVVGFDTSGERLEAIRSGEVDLLERDRQRLADLWLRGAKVPLKKD